MVNFLNRIFKYKQKDMNVLLSCDSKIAKYIPALQASLYENHKDKKVKIFLMHSGISLDVISEIKQFALSYDNKFVDILVDKGFYEFFNNRNDTTKYPLECFFYLFAHKYLPRRIDRILCLDIDIIINKSIYDFYSSDFNNKYFIAPGVFLEPTSTGILNSGVLIMNLKKFILIQLPISTICLDKQLMM